MFFVNNFKITKERVTEFLGIYIDENLTWKYHMDHICRKVSKSIEIMYKSRYIFSKRLMKKLYFSLFIAT